MAGRGKKEAGRGLDSGRRGRAHGLFSPERWKTFECRGPHNAGIKLAGKKDGLGEWGGGQEVPGAQTMTLIK